MIMVNPVVEIQKAIIKMRISATLVVLLVLAFAVCVGSNPALSATVFKDGKISSSSSTSSSKTIPLKGKLSDDAFTKPKWKISCTPDKGALTKKGKGYVLKTSKNNCDGGVFGQRTELFTGSIPANHKGQYVFVSDFRLKTKENNLFSVFSIHDGRKGCAPPIQIFVTEQGYLRLRGDYKYGDGESCDRDILKTKYTFKQKVKRDGTEQQLKVFLDFIGNGDINVEVHLNSELVATTAYRLPAGRGFLKSRGFFAKHGVYSHKMFDYVLETEFSLKKN